MFRNFEVICFLLKEYQSLRHGRSLEGSVECARLEWLVVVLAFGDLAVVIRVAFARTHPLILLGLKGECHDMLPCLGALERLDDRDDGSIAVLCLDVLRGHVQVDADGTGVDCLHAEPVYDVTLTRAVHHSVTSADQLLELLDAN